MFCVCIVYASVCYFALLRTTNNTEINYILNISLQETTWREIIIYYIQTYIIMLDYIYSTVLPKSSCMICNSGQTLSPY